MTDFNQSDLIIDMGTTVISQTNNMKLVCGIIMSSFIKV